VASRTANLDFIWPTIDLEMSQSLSEDDIYRTSTQYRLWSFAPEALATLRKQTHDLAIERARQYAGERVLQNGDVAINGASQQNGDVDMERIDCLTEEEELRLVQRYCDQIRTTSDHFKWPVNVKVSPPWNAIYTVCDANKLSRRLQYNISSASSSPTPA
jgi:hypothetical protein